MGQYKRQRNRPKEEQVTVYGKQKPPFYSQLKAKLRTKGFTYFCRLQIGQTAYFHDRIIARAEPQKAEFCDGDNKGQRFFVEPYTLVRTSY